MSTSPHRVLIAGAGVAGLEAVVALHRLAGDRVAVTLVSPSDEFTIKALSVNEPFGGPVSAAYDVETICADHGATFRRDALHTVHPQYRSVVMRSGRDAVYDSLLVAIGARPRVVFEDALTFRGAYDADLLAGLLRTIDGGRIGRVAFVIPAGTTWPLPLYELALMTAEHVAERGGTIDISLVTPEEQPLALFGARASDDVARVLAEHGVTVHTSAHVRSVAGGTVAWAPGDALLEADVVVAAPALTGPGLRGLPHDDHGFVAVESDARVRGLDDVFGAGDGTTVPVKQGGVAAQQADTAAHAIAMAAGAPVEPLPFRPVLRSVLLTGSASRFLRDDVTGGAGAQSSQAGEAVTQAPTAKVAAPYLAPYLARLSGEPGTELLER